MTDLLAPLGSLQRAQEAEARGRLDDAWAACLDAIAERPFHPEAYLQLASIAAAAGDLRTATHAVDRAHAMAPRWSEATALRTSLATRTSQHSTPAGNPTRFELPEPQSRLSVCLIVKNEERFLDNCLRSVVPIAQEILVVDTGSTDRTVEIARAHGARVEFFEWCDDFSAARNAGLAKARGDWILVLDADEEILAEDRNRLLEEMRSDSNHLLLRLRCIQDLNGRRFQAYVPRLFRNAPGIRFQDPIHESVTQSVGMLCRLWGLDLGLSKTGILHHGYAADVIQERGKIGRNHALLLRAVADAPGNAYMQMQLGSEYLRMDQAEKAFGHFDAAIRLCEDAEHLIPDSVEGLLTLYGTNLLKKDRFQETEALLTGRLATRFPPTAWHLYLRGRARMQMGRLPEALQDLLDCLARRHEETLSIVPADLDTPELEFLIGELHQKLGHLEEAERFFRRAQERDRTSARFAGATAQVLRQRGDVAAALGILLEALPAVSEPSELWEQGGRIALDTPGLEAFGVEWLEDALRHHAQHPRLGLMLGAALIQNGQVAEAHAWFQSLPGDRDAKMLGGLVFSGVCIGTPDLPSLSPQQQRSTLLSIAGILDRLHQRGRLDLVHQFRSAVTRHSQDLPWMVEVFGAAADPLSPEPTAA